ncbi:uncharacterized protein LOC102708241 isoform X1 [Oryza brachyantha]|uniref:uncharacterized protein LOC102708241 isoform X1 n=1 Tax=Oryza brachyantha TaxID=4533 RepID=UPI00077623EB|nr:uncharacterized protein LOC102708241 isoform X1 [Oryza brachyantha]XP_040379600.1 uncharacterized protein LOC102708241 isoform X1 [Oryza brachyantha]
MTSQSDSPDMIFPVYTPRKRKFEDSVQHSESSNTVSHGSGLVASAKHSHRSEESSHLGPAQPKRSEESFIKSLVGFSSILNNSQGFGLQDIPSETTELSGIRYTTSQHRPNETILHTISTDNGTTKCQDPIQSFSLVMECTNHTISSKPMHPHITFQLMHTKIESGNSYAKCADSTYQSQKAVTQNLLLNCEKGDQSFVAMDHPSLSPHDKTQQKEGIPSYEAIKHDVQDSTKAIDIPGTLSPHSLDDEITSVVGQLSPSVYESLWDGTIQLSRTVKVSVIAFFKSGEKNHDITWPKVIEIKGKVKLDAFEKFIQELRRCQTRALMVISLCWKFGTSKAGLRGMKEVAENFEVSQKVGFADICDGFSLYVCPRSDAVITILAKYGFFKGMSAFDTNQDTLIGCIVWRRNPLSKIMDHNRSETIGKGSPCALHVESRPLASLPFSEGYEATSCSTNPGMDSSRNASKIQNDIDHTQENRVKKLAVATGLPSQCGHAENTGERVHHIETLSQVPPFETTLHEFPEIQKNVQHITDSRSGYFGVGHPISHSQEITNFNPVFQPDKAGVKGLSLKFLDVQQRTIHYDLAAQKSYMVEAFSGSLTRQEYAPDAAESSKQHDNNPFLLHPNTCGSDTTNDTDDLPEFDFANLHKVEVKYDVHPLNMETAITSEVLIRPKLSDSKSSRPLQQSSQPSFQVEGIKNHDNVEVNVTHIMSRGIMNQVSRCETENFNNRDGIDAEDMVDRNFQGSDNEKPHQSNSTKQSSPSLKTFTGSRVPSHVFPLVPERSNNPLEREDISSGHHPDMPPGCLNIPRDQGSFTQHHPPVLGDQRLAARHPAVLADQAPIPRVPPPVLEDQSFVRCPPPSLPGEGFIPWHPPVPADQGFVPLRPPPLADQGSFPRRAPPAHFPRRPFHANQGAFPRHRPPHPRLPFAPGHMRPPGNFAPPGPWRPVLHPGQEHRQYGPPGRSNSPCGSGNVPGQGHHRPNFRNGPGCRPAHQAHR